MQFLGLDLEPVGFPNLNDKTIIFPLNPALHKKWKRRNVDALCAIVTSVSDSTLTLIQHTIGTYSEINMKLEVKHALGDSCQARELVLPSLL